MDTITDKYGQTVDVGRGGLRGNVVTITINKGQGESKEREIALGPAEARELLKGLADAL